MKKIIIENYRCFKKYQEIELKPLTILVGENSTGKSSLLAAIRLASKVMPPNIYLDFNEEPFVLGAYKQIASYARGRAGRARIFKIGCERSFGQKDKMRNFRIVAGFVPEKDQPFLSELVLEDLASGLQSKAEVNPGSNEARITVSFREEAQPVKEVVSKDAFWSFALVQNFTEALRDKQQLQDTDFSPFFLYSIESIVYAFAPTRTRPQRTYDPRSTISHPEGGHVPSLLYLIENDPEKGAQFRKEIEQFGKASGLFERFKVRRLGTETDPFQILVKIGGAPNNLLDVGYGVSQVLPIIVDTLLRREAIFLMQQPEIHLHPRAQAELGTYIGHLAKVQGKQFIVETHSDFIIDRIRLDVRDGKTGLCPDDVLILFFQRRREQPWVKVHPIRIDANGNIKDAPKGYRAFFLDEQARLFNI